MLVSVGFWFLWDVVMVLVDDYWGRVVCWFCFNYFCGFEFVYFWFFGVLGLDDCYWYFFCFDFWVIVCGFF